MKLKLSRVLKIISTILIAVGVAYLFLFVMEQNRNVTDILEQPSYYAIQNYKMLFLSGIAVVACSVLGSFFSWSEKIDPKEQILMNAGYTSAENIDTWLKGSTAEETSRTLKQTSREPVTVETSQTLKQTFSKPFEAPSTVVLGFEPSETVKKIEEIAEPEAELEVASAPVEELEPEVVFEPEVVAGSEMEKELESEFESEEEEAAITETLDGGDDEENPADDKESMNTEETALNAKIGDAFEDETGEGTEITEILDNDDDDGTAITETLEDDNEGKEADA
jgi:hypothetical protein